MLVDIVAGGCYATLVTNQTVGGHMNNPYFPAGQEDIDKEAIADEVWDLACETNKTQCPTEKQLAQAEAELTKAWEAWENEGWYL